MNPNSTSVRIVAQRHHQGVDLGQAVIEFEAGRRDVFHAERLTLIDDADLLLLREVFSRIESVANRRSTHWRGLSGKATERQAVFCGSTATTQMRWYGASVCRSTVIDPFSSGTRFTSTAALWARKSRLADCTCSAAAAWLGRWAAGAASLAGGSAPNASPSAPLLSRLRAADGPRIEQQARPLQRVARELGRVPAVDDVAVLVT